MIVNHKANRVFKVYQDQVLFASTFNEAADELVRLELAELLERSRGDLRRTVYQLALKMAGLPILAGTEGEAIVGSHEFLIGVDAHGNLLQSDEGFLTAGSAAQFAAGAAKALLTFSDFSLDQIARQSLLLAASLSPESNDQIFYEQVSAIG